MMQYKCSKCGSSNVRVITPGVPGALGALMNLFRGSGMPAGRICIECKDCGRKSVLMAN